MLDYLEVESRPIEATGYPLRALGGQFSSAPLPH